LKKSNSAEVCPKQSEEQKILIDKIIFFMIACFEKLLKKR